MWVRDEGRVTGQGSWVKKWVGDVGWGEGEENRMEVFK